MSSKLVSLSTTSFHSKSRTTFTESVELVDLVKRVLSSTSSILMTSNSTERSKIITTLKSKKYLKTLKLINEKTNLIEFTFNSLPRQWCLAARQIKGHHHPSTTRHRVNYNIVNNNLILSKFNQTHLKIVALKFKNRLSIIKQHKFEEYINYLDSSTKLIM